MQDFREVSINLQSGCPSLFIYSPSREEFGHRLVTAGPCAPCFWSAWAEQYRTCSRSGGPKWALGQFGPEAAQSQHFLKGILTGSRRPTFSRILGVLSVLDGLPSLGAKGTCLFAFGPDCRSQYRSVSKNGRN